ncbi:MAG: F-box-like [Chlamydiales bacterium]|jgi:hypothetical protein|nr:F-box-like [Chlamydiales bacterium]
MESSIISTPYSPNQYTADADLLNTGIGVIPEELLVKIFSNFDIGTLAKVSQVSRQWRNIGYETLKQEADKINAISNEIIKCFPDINFCFEKLETINIFNLKEGISKLACQILPLKENYKNQLEVYLNLYEIVHSKGSILFNQKIEELSQIYESFKLVDGPRTDHPHSTWKGFQFTVTPQRYINSRLPHEDVY